jgi:recombination protein RecA
MKVKPKPINKSIYSQIYERNYPMAFQKPPEKPKPTKVVIEAPVGKAEKFKRILATAKLLNTEHETTHALVRLGDKVNVRLPSIATGLTMFDEYVIQTGGLPKGRTVEIFGPESAGKTSAALHFIGECQAAGGIAAFVDAEHALDPNYAKVFGVNLDDLLVSQPDCGEEALDIVEKLIDTQAVDLIVVDSVAALVPRAELMGDIEDANVGLHARLMSKAMRRIVGRTAKTGCIVVFINQIREKIGVMFGNPETTTGGRALKFFASIRIDVRRISEGIKVNDILIGHQIKLKAVKNKCGVPFREAVVDLYYTSGFDKEASLIEYADSRGLFKKNGPSWYQMDLGNGYENIANGLTNLKIRLKSDPTLLTNVKANVQKLIEMEANTETTK